MTDPYALSAEFYDVMAHQQWRAAGPLIAKALRGVDASEGPLLEVGAGTGLSTERLAQAVPDADILAVEPSAGMRIALTSRLFSQPELAKRVTVEPLPIDRVELPERLCAAVVVGVVGYIEPEARQVLWQSLATRLSPGAPVIVDVMAVPKPMRVPNMRIAQARIGQLDYEVFMTGEPEGELTMRWNMTYKVSRNGQALRTFEADHTWQAFGLELLIKEAQEAGFQARKITPHMVAFSMPA